METDFWLKCWRDGHTGWHRDTPEPSLMKYWPKLAVPKGTQVLVPFCGKSPDLLWLAEQGLQVLGVEVSSLAIEQFFADNSLVPHASSGASGPRFSVDNITIIQGNLFDVRADTLGACGAIYDRAAMVAQSPDEREHYAADVYGRLPAGCRGLLVAFEYPQADMNGPPFSVPEAEVRARFGATWDITILNRQDILSQNPGFRDRGMTALDIVVYQLRH